MTYSMSTCSTDKNDTLPTASGVIPHNKPAAKPGVSVVKKQQAQLSSPTVVNHPALSNKDIAIDNDA